MINVRYQDLLHDVALRMNALVGGDVTAINTTYNVAVLNASHFKSVDWPFASFKAAILMAVADFAWAIADTGGHPWRSQLGALTTSLANQAALPSLSAAGREIIGAWGVVRDATSGIPLTEQPLDVVRRIVQETWRKYPLYFFKIDGNYIEHTRTNVVIECCTYSKTEQSTAFDANTEMLLPDVLQLPVVARTISIMTKDGAFEGQAALYRAYGDEALMRIRSGLTTLPAKTLPSPTVSQT